MEKQLEHHVIRVLLCDDQQIVRVAIEEALSLIPAIEFMHVENCASVLTAIESFCPSVLLQDLVLPDGSGIDVVKQLRSMEKYRDLPILLLSTTDDPKIKYDAFSSGASDYVVKFPEPYELVGRVTYHARAYQNLIEREEAMRLLEQKTRLESLGNLAAGIAHEINTPLQYISANVDYVLEALRLLENIDKDYIAALHETREGVEQISRIVRAMKSFAHPGKQELIKINLNDIAQDVQVLTRNEWKDFSDFSLDLDPLLPSIYGIPGGVAQVLINLIVNSSHAIREENVRSGKRGHIYLKTTKDVNNVVVEVSDTGGGIPEHVQNRIFDPFFTTKDVGVGSGQGLSIVRSIVEAHRASITFQSVIGEGTTFTIRFPLERVHDSNSTGVTL